MVKLIYPIQTGFFFRFLWPGEGGALPAPLYNFKNALDIATK